MPGIREKSCKTGNDGFVRHMSDELVQLQERVAHLMRAVDDLSDVVARQETEITRLTRRVSMLIEREAARSEAGVDAPEANQRPPHW
jgi:SlyX protein